MGRSRIDVVFLRGLAAILPMALTLYIVWWLVSSAEHLLGSMIRWMLPKGLYFPGLGLVMAVLLVFIAGLFMSAWLTRALYGLGEHLVERIPIVKSIYGMLRDMLEFFTHQRQAQYSQVVMLRLGDSQVQVLGLVTREDFSGLPTGLSGSGQIGVYVPMSYQVGGFLLMVPRSAVQPVAMSFEAAMRFAVTAGMGGGEVGQGKQ